MFVSSVPCPKHPDSENDQNDADQWCDYCGVNHDSQRDQRHYQRINHRMRQLISGRSLPMPAPLLSRLT